jgi:flagellar protein FlaG
MDVQAAGASATIVAPVFTQIVSSPAPASDSTPSAVPAANASAVVTAPSTNDHGSSNAGNNGGSSNQSSSGATGGAAIGPTPGLATLPAGPPDGTKKGAELDQTLASNGANLYNVQQQDVSVSFQIQQDPNEIVMVFTDKQTGKVIVQFPSETMIALAKLFDKLDGGVVNKKV